MNFCQCDFKCLILGGFYLGREFLGNDPLQLG